MDGREIYRGNVFRIVQKNRFLAFLSLNFYRFLSYDKGVHLVPTDILSLIASHVVLSLLECK